jgi:hypothetical protein
MRYRDIDVVDPEIHALLSVIEPSADSYGSISNLSPNITISEWRCVCLVGSEGIMTVPLMLSC